jgi:hypothetical protein
MIWVMGVMYPLMELVLLGWATQILLGKHGGGSHMNFETLVPNPSKPGKMMIDKNLHIYLED